MPLRVPPGELTPRQAEVMALVTQGLRHKQIAARLFVCEGRVKQIIRHAKKRLGCKTLLELIVKWRCMICENVK